jgi:tRNA-specific 2-thiouridylase
MGRVVVAMSGGVDSSVAAALVRDAGHEAVGVTLKLLPRLDTGFGCCGSPRDVADARDVCDRLGLPHYVVDLHEAFEQRVVAPFVEAYRSGRTPNPCVECNRHLKFHTLAALAEAWGASAVATGHYARIVEAGGERRLLRAADAAKDQTYFLYRLGQRELARALFPLGSLTKAEVRQRARALGLPTAEKEESFEVCFVRGDYRDLLEQRGARGTPGEIRNTSGARVGRHQGLGSYTVGQRHGLGLALGRPAYVVALEPASNTLVVGPREEAQASEALVSEVCWTRAPVFGRPVEVKVRHRSRPAAAVLEPEGKAVRVRFAQPQFAPAPGQSAVFYEDDEVLGGGILA